MEIEKYYPETREEIDLLEKIRLHNITLAHEEHEWEKEIRETLEKGEELPPTDAQWKYTVDNHFANSFFSKSSSSDTLLPTLCSSSFDLCERCSAIDLHQPIHLSPLHDTMRCCDLCALLSRCFDAVKETNGIQILERRSEVRICTTPDIKAAHPDIQIGFPKLLEPESSTRFELLREWLRVCDEAHKYKDCHLEWRPELPTRILDIGYDDDPYLLYLYTSNPGDRGDYIALSHCWGELLREQMREFCTSRENILDRCTRGFDLRTLPRTFRDAVRVTRELGKRYLWIDSLCIIQDDRKDWATESRRMETVFNNAYCTIAASTAEDSNKGFLTRQPEQQQQQQPYVKLHTSSHGTVYICSTVDDFDRHVESESPLNRRAWVLQERALSRRTIHFAAGQCYWECGDGVRCETLTYMRSTQALFLGDPRFPEFVKFRGDDDQVSLFQYLFTRYSQLGLTMPVDKPIAISGLERRLAKTIQTKCMHGIFEKYLHRSLLWQRSEFSRMKRICYANEQQQVPSWSWMAHNGTIEYIEIDFGTVEWTQEIRLAGNALKARVRNFAECEIEKTDEGRCAVRDVTGSGLKGWFRYDSEDRMDIRKLRCVVVGREKRSSEEVQREWHSGSIGKRKCYILVVMPLYHESCRVYERVGVGIIPQGNILFAKAVADMSSII